jgi:hypothetical protein
MTALRDRTIPIGSPTPEHPNVTELGVEDLPLSRVACWREDELYVIRSLEYDVIAADEDLGVAVRKFVSTTIEYADMLGQTEESTREDVELALMIFGRMAKIAAALAPAEQPRRRGGLIERVRGHRGQRAPHGWQLHPAALN